MPRVGTTEFDYTPAGMQKAKAWSEMTGKPMQMKQYKEGGTPEKSKDNKELEDIAKWRELMTSTSPIDVGMIQLYLNRWLKSTGQDTLIKDSMLGPKTLEAMKKAKEAYGGKQYQFGGQIPQTRQNIRPRPTQQPMRQPMRRPMQGAGMNRPMQRQNIAPPNRAAQGQIRRRPPMQTSQQGMPMRGSQGLQPGSPMMYKKGGKVMPKGYHV